MRIQAIANSRFLPRDQKEMLVEALSWRVARFDPVIAGISLHFYGDSDPVVPGIHVVLFRVEFKDGSLLLLDGYIRSFRNLPEDDLLDVSLARLEASLEQRLDERRSTLPTQAGGS